MFESDLCDFGIDKLFIKAKLAQSKTKKRNNIRLSKLMARKTACLNVITIIPVDLICTKR